MMQNLIPHFIAERFEEGNYSGEFNAIALFVDIKGFSSLTEKLGNFGKEGVEILSGIINEVFNPCIRTVYDAGGFITSFMGDSFLIIFKDYYSNALWSAKEIINEFSRQKVKKTRLGDFELSVKIGISYGEVEWGIIGFENKKTYYFKGEAIDNCSQSEKVCGPMEIMADEVFHAEFNDGQLAYEYCDGYYRILLDNNISREFIHKTSYNIKESILKVFVNEHIIESEPVGELKDIVSVFLSFRDIDNSYDSMNEFSKVLLITSDKWGGYFSRISFGDKGGSVLINFGIPVSYERNIYRAISFMHEIRSAYTDNIRAGITLGRLYAGFIGSDLRSAYDVLGNSVNISSRIAMNAHWGQIWISKNIKNIAEDAWTIDFIKESAFKNISNKIMIYKIVGKKDIINTFFSGKFYGREIEIKQIKDGISPVFNKQYAGIMYIYGEAGIGKSRLVYEALRDQKDKIDLYYMHCNSIIKKSWDPFILFFKHFFKQSPDNPMSQNETLFESKFSDIIENIEGIGNKSSNAIVSELKRTKPFFKGLLSLDTRGTIYEMLDAKTRHENICYGIKEFFKGLSLIKPLIIILEDIHSMDMDSISLVKHLTSNINDFPMALICTSRYRDDGSKTKLEINDPVNVYDIELKSLSKDSSFRLIREKLGKPPNNDLLQFIRIKTSNNPFFIEQFCSYLLEKEFIIHHKNNCILREITDDIPVKINQILTARIDRLSQELKELMKIASVFGLHFEKKLVLKPIERLFQKDMEFSDKDRKLFNLPALSNILDSDQSKYLKEGQKEYIWESFDEIKYRFINSNIHESAYDMQLRRRLRLLHSIIADTMEKEIKNHTLSKDHYIDLAYHFERSEIIHKTREYLEKSGDYLAQIFKNELAIEKYHMLLNYITEPIEEIKTRLKMVKILLKTGKLDDLEDILFYCLGLSEKLYDISLTGQSNILLGILKSSLGDFEKAIEYFNKAEELFSQAGNNEYIAQASEQMGLAYFILGDYNKSLDYYNKFADITVKLEKKSDSGLAKAYIANIYRVLGKYEESLKYYEESLQIIQEAEDKEARGIAFAGMGHVYLLLGNYHKALESYEINLKIAEEIGHKKNVGLMMGNIGNIFLINKDYSKALKYYEAHRKIALEIGHRYGLSLATGNIGIVYREMGDLDKAIRYSREHNILAEEIKDKNGIGLSKLCLAILCRMQKEFTKALDLLCESLKIHTDIGDNYNIGIVNCYMGSIYYDLKDNNNALISLSKGIDILKSINIRDKHLFEFLLIKSKILLFMHKGREAELICKEGILLAETLGDKDYMQEAQDQMIEIKNFNSGVLNRQNDRLDP